MTGTGPDRVPTPGSFMMRMPFRILLLMTVLLLPAPLVAQSDRAADEDAAIRATIERYFRGDIERDVAHLQAAFHPSAVLQTSDKDGALSILRQAEWHERVRLTPARERPTARILQIDRTGSAAMAKTQLLFSNGQFTDYLSLLKLEDRWIIVNKIYQWEGK